MIETYLFGVEKIGNKPFGRAVHYFNSYSVIKTRLAILAVKHSFLSILKIELSTYYGLRAVSNHSTIGGGGGGLLVRELYENVSLT